MIDVNPNIFVFWKLSWMPCKLRDKNQSVQRLSVNILTRWLLDSDIQILLNIGQGNGLLPDDTKTLFKPMFTYPWWRHVMFTWGQYHWARGSWKCWRYQTLPVEYVAKFREEWFIINYIYISKYLDTGSTQPSLRRKVNHSTSPRGGSSDNHRLIAKTTVLWCA